MNTEPARLISALSAAATATVGLLTIVGVLSEQVGGALTTALAAWIVVGGEIIRSRVTPVKPEP